MRSGRQNIALAVAAGISAFLGLALAAGGGWLIALGGSWYYLIAGLVLIAVAVLLIRRRSEALWLYALLIAVTLAWAVWEAGLSWWPLAARADLLFLLGLFLLTPWVTRPLVHRQRSTEAAREQYAPAVRRAVLPLGLALSLLAVVSIATWFVEPQQIKGMLPGSRVQVAADAQGVPAGEWHAYGRDGFGQRYSPLTQITPQNADQLEVAWHYETGDMRGREGDPEETTFEVTPLKIGDRLYFCTPHQSVIALNATTGQEIWRYDPQIQGELALQHLTCRGLSYHAGQASSAGAGPDLPEASNDKVPAPPGQPVAAQDGQTSEQCQDKLFMPTADGRIIALNPDDGTVCQDFGGGTGQINLWANMPNVKPGGYYSTSPVVVTESLIIVGGTVLDNVSTQEPSGVIRAFDVNTGQLVWNWDPGNPESTEPIAAGDTYTASSPNSWSISSVDEKLGMVYVPFGNQPPDQWGGERTASVGRYSSAVVALDLASGKERWHFQTVHHDLWDYDVPSQPSLIDLSIGGNTIPALVQPTKQGELFVLDRRSGEPVLPVHEAPVPQGAAKGDTTAETQPVSTLSYDPPKLSGADMWGATMIDQMACRIRFQQLRYEGRYTPPSEQGTLVYPGNFGVFNWGGIAVDPQRQIAFTTPTYLAFVSRLVPRADDETLYVQGGNRPQNSLPSLNENFGAPFAIELSAFTSALGLPCQAPPWGYVAGADLTSGDIVWKHKNGTVIDSSPLPLPFNMGVPNLGGPMLTAGGVAFLSGTLDYYVRAYNVSNGEQLWESRLPAGGQATPMTYIGEDGRQYVLVVAGGHGSLGTKAGDDVIAYALPQK
ncbi:membrane-bound PQQ-dependent dehydrogenase, glucose/quinate/shikimate family [Pusillimonas sp. SM2304]|uniref:membrane-bound PQQ-dependent dehydrogenase, glucose/quinate/shikimate family n=1 Tax=Pusillimonas sp. SM2304 TaxID=3073241 RepID=UPI0028746B89|nr:membrane-bound PQQ-dependent dehydrogenase, glucose/quinate/shikimate family [Pusillimonas sp. SM2304]MDS1141851.1 membrane-bound PQQ-dependent dehydrogenase, glucose/quinate/shikimate family [Pusillimonas sp. SM2304]